MRPLGSRPSVGIFFGRPDRCYFLASSLRERGFDVVTYNTEAYRNESYVPVRASWWPALRQVLTRSDHDVYFTGLSFAPSLCLYVNRRLRRRPYVFNVTGAKWEFFSDRSAGKPFARSLERRVYPALLDRIFAGASQIVCNSRFLESRLADRFPRYRSRLATVYNGVDFERYASGVRLRLPGTRADDLILLCVTTVNYHNKSAGLRIVLDAFGHICAARSGVKLVIAAKRSSHRYSEALERYIASKPWRNSVSILYNSPSVPDLLASADIFVFATPNDSNDSLPRVLLEAQTAGVPAVVSATSGCPEIVADGTTGFVVPYDARAIAERVLTLAGDPELRRQMSVASRQRSREVFSWDEMADRYAAIFYRVIGEESGVPHGRAHADRASRATR